MGDTVTLIFPIFMTRLDVEAPSCHAHWLNKVVLLLHCRVIGIYCIQGIPRITLACSSVTAKQPRTCCEPPPPAPSSAMHGTECIWHEVGIMLLLSKPDVMAQHPRASFLPVGIAPGNPPKGQAFPQPLPVRIADMFCRFVWISTPKSLRVPQPSPSAKNAAKPACTEPAAGEPISLTPVEHNPGGNIPRVTVSLPPRRKHKACVTRRHANMRVYDPQKDQEIVRWDVCSSLLRDCVPLFLAQVLGFEELWGYRRAQSGISQGRREVPLALLISEHLSGCPVHQSWPFTDGPCTPLMG